MDQLPVALAHALTTNCGFHGSAARRGYALFKTHKTGSSTVELMLARTAYLKGLLPVSCVFNVGSHFFRSGGCDLTLEPGLVQLDVSLRHNFMVSEWWNSNASDWGCDHGDGRWFDQLVHRTYQRIMNNSFVPVLIPTRAPKEHLLSAMHYYGVTQQEMASSPGRWNPLAKDFRLLSKTQADDFVRRWPENTSNSNRIFPIILEAFDASLVSLRRQLRWDLKEMVYARVIHKGDAGAQFKYSHTGTVPSNWISWDAVLYQSFVELYQRQRQQVFDSTFEHEVLALRRMSMALEAVCNESRAPGGLNRIDGLPSKMLKVWCAYATGSELFAEKESTKGCARI